MTKKLIIVCMALGLAACSTVQVGPLDDAYYYPDKNEAAVEQKQTAQTAQTVRTTPSAPSVEYVSVKDTTVTIRIKK